MDDPGRCARAYG